MWRRISAVARMGWWDYIYRRNGIGLLVFVGLFLVLPSLTISRFVTDPQVAANVLQSALAKCWSMGKIWAGLFSLTSVLHETKQRTLCAVMIRPIERWEYLTGRCLALAALFVQYMLLSALIALGFAWYNGCTLAASTWPLGAAEVCAGLMWIFVMLPLAAVARTGTTVALLIVGGLMGAVVRFVPSDGPTPGALGYDASWARMIKIAWHYLTPVAITPHGAGWAWGGALVANLGYGIAALLVCSAIYTTQDVKLRE